jgi:hypothetical protein
MMKKTVAVAAAVLLVFIAAVIWADTIELKSGKIIEGTIVEETDDLVAVEVNGATGFYSKEDIKSINKSRLDVAKGKLIQVTGQVEVLPKGEAEWKTAGKGTSLNEGDQIRSGPDSKAVATFANQLIVAVEKDSALELEKLQQSKKTGMDVKLKLGKGQIWNDVGTLRNKNSKFYIETPQAVTGVRGTIFSVRTTTDAKTNVAVVKGTVDVRTRGMMMTPVKIAENTMTDVLENMPPVAPTDISEEFLAQWKQYRNQFRFLRFGMIGGNIGLSPMQTVVAAVILLIVLMVLVRVLFLRRRKSAS